MVLSTDEFFTDDEDVYKFDASKIEEAHDDCLKRTEEALRSCEHVGVANTFTRAWEMQDYFQLAERLGARVFTFVVENRHGSQSVHNVPEHTVDRMRKRFEVVL